MENECAEHICIDMEILMMTKFIMPLQARYPGAPMNSIEKALESERAIISGGHLMYVLFPLNKIVIRNIFPEQNGCTSYPHSACPLQKVCYADDALSGNAKGTGGITERHVHTFCNVVTLSPSPIVINHDALLFCCVMGLLSWWYYSMRTLNILEWYDYSKLLSYNVA